MCFHSLHDIGSIIYQARRHKCQTISLATMSALDWRQRFLMGHQDANDHYVALGVLYEAGQASHLLSIQLGEGNFKEDDKGKGVPETTAILTHATRQTALNWGMNWRQRLIMGHSDANDHYVSLGMLSEGYTNFKGKGKGVLETGERFVNCSGGAIFGSSEDQPELPGIQDGSVRNVSKYKAEWLKAKQKEITKKAQYLKARAWARANAMPTRAKAKAKAHLCTTASSSKRRWKLCGMCPNCQAARQEHDYSQDGQLWDNMYEYKEEQEEEEEEEEEEAEPVPDL